MKPFTLLLFVFFLIPFNLFSQCPPGDLAFQTQEELDSFLIDFPNCTMLEGSINILFTDEVSNLSAFQNITSIDGDLRIVGVNNTEFVSLEGLDNLSYVGGAITIQSNDWLQETNTLSNLEFVGEQLELKNMNLINSINLQSLISVGHNLTLENLPELHSIEGLNELIFVGFGLNLLNCTQLSDFPSLPNVTYLGGLFIAETGIPNLDAFQHVETFSGLMALGNNPSLNNIEAFADFDSFSGGIWLFNNPNLNNLNGLENVTTLRSLVISRHTLSNLNPLSNLEIVETDFVMDRIFGIPDLSPFQNIGFIGRDIFLGNIPALINLTDFSNLDAINGNLEIRENENFISFTGLELYSSIGGSFIVSNNPILSSFDGMSSLQWINEDFICAENGSLVSFEGLNELAVIDSSFVVRDNDVLQNFEGLESLYYGGGKIMQVVFNDVLIDFQGLNELLIVSPQLTIVGNELLESLDGLEEVTTFASPDNQSLTIENNGVLSDISALSNLSGEYIQELRIINNPVLSECAINPVCEVILASVENAMIHSNLTGCNGTPEIDCEPTNNKEIPIKDVSFTIQPNPADDIVILSFAKNDFGSSLVIYNNHGQKIFASPSLEEQIISIDSKNWPAGIYLITIQKENQIKQEKLIIY